LLEARPLAAEMHLEFTQSAEAANRAVMAQGDDVAAAAAEEARRARDVVERDIQSLRAALESLRYGDDLRYLNDRRTGSIPVRFTRTSSRSRAAAATFARWRCPWAKTGT
jgi:hypothetical protein